MLVAALALMLAHMQATPAPEPRAMTNPVGYFEIPVRDLDRAARFYGAVFGYSFERVRIDGYAMALFPAGADRPGASGALVKGDVYRPGKAGPVLYFSVTSIDDALMRAGAVGARILYPKKSIGEFGHVAEIEDSEGNRIALHQARD